jgi:hypothetical protein
MSTRIPADSGSSSLGKKPPGPPATSVGVVQSSNQNSKRPIDCGENPDESNNSPAAVGYKSLNVTVH